MDVGRFERLVNELFVDNFTYTNRKYVNPLNAEELAPQFDRSARMKKDFEREWYGSLVVVTEAIERDGGITESVYEANKFAINSIARDMTYQRWWGSGLDSRCVGEDREGMKATPQQISRFPEDGKYGEIKDGSHVNVFDEGYKTSSFEGTLFQTEFDGKGHLATYRIFHQGHRNGLKIASVDVSKLVDKINDYVANFKGEVDSPSFGFTLDCESYLERVEEFNAEFGDYVRIKVLGERREAHIVAEFKDNPEKLGDKFVEYGTASGLEELKKNKGTMTFTVWGQNYKCVDLFLQRHLERPHACDPFDSDRDKDEPTVILPYLAPELSIPLITAYVSAQE